MKKFFIVIISVLLFGGAQAAGVDTLGISAQKAYQGGQFTTAIDRYNQILDGGQHSAELYYNLGNAYYKNGMMGQAILNYSRALRLDPSMEDARYNMSVASASTVDKIEAVPEFFVVTYLNGLREMISSSGWAILSIIFLAIALAGVILWLVVDRLSLRKVGFTMLVIFGLMSIVSFSCSLVSYNIAHNSTEAVVINTAAPVSSAPLSEGKDLFVLHEGTLLRVVDRADDWCEVEIANGEKGWLECHSIEVI
ncbi:MAG: tetratricopeptide repeat protein [Mucinivorans sp.]